MPGKTKAALPVAGPSFALQTEILGRRAAYLHEELGETRIKGNTKKVILDETEDGYLYGFIIQVSDIDMRVSVKLHGEEGSVFPLLNQSPREYVRLGLGLAPGDIKRNPDNSVPDPAGRPNQTYPWMARYYQHGDVADGTGSTQLKMTFAYTPQILLPYHRIQAEIFNPPSSGNQFIKYVAIDRIVFTE